MKNPKPHFASLFQVGDKKQQEILGNTTRYKNLKNHWTAQHLAFRKLFPKVGDKKKRMASRNGLSRPMKSFARRPRSPAVKSIFCWWLLGCPAGTQDQWIITSMHLPKLERPHTTSPHFGSSAFGQNSRVSALINWSRSRDGCFWQHRGQCSWFFCGVDWRDVQQRRAPLQRARNPGSSSPRGRRDCWRVALVDGR